MKKLSISLENKQYDIIIKNGLLDEASFYINKIYKNKKIYIITDTNVAPLYLDKLQNNLKANYEVDSIIINAGEEYKNIDTYKYVAEKLISFEIRRSELIIALGGGVVGDLSAFIASTILRGVKFINIPTTLLSQVDSSIGGKTGIDFMNKKNILGTFYQPSLVLIDIDTLKTLNDIEFKSGMGELIKHAFIGSKKLLEMLKLKHPIDEDVIYESLMVKKKIVELDPYDLNVRMYLNFGHTFGHVIELKYNLKHGIAVSYGMIMALKLGLDLKIGKKENLELLYDILNNYNFKIEEYDYHDYLNDIKSDKKNIARILYFILLSDLEQPLRYEIKEEKIEEL